MTDNNPFASTRKRIESANRHLARFEKEARAYAASNPLEIVFEADQVPGWSVAKVKLSSQPPDSIEDGVFDVLGNLRSALDYATHATARLAGKPETTKANFPFGGDANQVKLKGQSKGLSQDIPEPIFNFIEAMKPYKGGDDLLWSLNRNWNRNKHSDVLDFSFTHNGFELRQETLIQPRGPFPAIWDDSKDEAILFAIPSPHIATFRIRVALMLTFKNLAVIAGGEILTTLSKYGRLVETVVDQIEAEAKRIGLIP